jgi:DNA-binding NarL/FixJ family response regulator
MTRVVGAAREGHVGDELRVLLVTSRPGIRALLGTIPSVSIEHVPMRLSAVTSSRSAIGNAMAAVIDAPVEPLEAAEICRELQRQRPQLPLVTLFCCSASVTPWHLEMLTTAGVRGVLDLHAAPDEIGKILQRIVRGQAVFHLHVDGESAGFLPRILAAERGRRAEALRLNATDADLLGYLAQGLPDRQIGERLHLSPHTIKHYIERLRDTVGARNRIELASWAGRHGFYPAREAIDADELAVPRRASTQLAIDAGPIAEPGYAIAVH